ncbi:MAG: hypothetical protein QF440_05520 [Candidatus Thalassarchaeaceae archaeon]|jgi:hypothetical protein|nr:hypothetical protein [Candidatus Thalassarchaeaceae archaeon]
MSEKRSDGSIPRPEDNSAEKMVFLQEQMVSFLNQYSMPLLETSLVLSKYTKQISAALKEHAHQKGEIVPPILSQPWPLIGRDSESSSDFDFEMDTLIENVDYDRMDIFDTILRTAIHATELPLGDSLMQLRQWEHLARNQLASARSPGQLFSPIEIPDDW